MFFFLLCNIAFYSGYKLIIKFNQMENSAYMQKAFDNMKTYIEVIKEYREELGIEIDKEYDPNSTGVIGEEYNEITTTMGHLQAKRTSTNPNMASLIVSFFMQLGLNAGDNVAIGSSGSFPSLLLATVGACEAMNLNPLIIISAGASQWGANIPDLTLIHMAKKLNENGYGQFKPIAVSIGGDDDIGRGLMGYGQAMLEDIVFNSGYEVIYEEDFEKNISRRMETYFKKANGGIKAFVNIGGAITNTGKSVEFLKLKPGINEIKEFPKASETGVLYEMAKKNVSVIHLLYMKGISTQYGIDYDPIPLPEELDDDINFDITGNSLKLKILLIAYYIFLFIMFSAFLLYRKSKN